MLKILQNQDATRRCGLVSPGESTWKSCLDTPSVIRLGISWQPDPEPKTGLGVSHSRHTWSETKSHIHVSLSSSVQCGASHYINTNFSTCFFFLSLKGHFNECICDNLQRLDMWHTCNTHSWFLEFWSGSWFILTSTIIIKRHCVFKRIQLVQVALLFGVQFHTGVFCDPQHSPLWAPVTTWGATPSVRCSTAEHTAASLATGLTRFYTVE